MGCFIEHVAIWTKRLEEMREFYCVYFGSRSNDGYHNPLKKFRSYFITFDGGARMELMQVEEMVEQRLPHPAAGYTHIAMALPSREEVDSLTEKISQSGFVVVSPPRTTGDGYYESVVLDPDGNRVELVAQPAEETEPSIEKGGKNP